MIITPLASWIDAFFDNHNGVPFSFTLEGQPSDRFITTWPCTIEESIDADRRKKIITLVDPESRLQLLCECVYWDGEDAVDWVLRFKNLGDVDSPVISNIRSLDATIIEHPKNACILHRSLGSNAQCNDFQPIADVIQEDKSIELFPIGGRSSNTSVFPFFNIEEQGEGGIVVAIGWSGQWVAYFRRDTTGVCMQAGLDVARLKLHPGEEIRAPRVLLMAWKGKESIAGHNQFRKLLIDHYVPRKDGVPVILPIANSGRRGQVFGEEANKFTEKNQLEMVDAMKGFGLECVWIDAGWFVGGWPDGVGSWFPRPNGFPRGLRPVADAARDAGMGFVLWFEPERVHNGSWLAEHHLEWLLNIPGSNNHLLNLGNDDARQWLTDHISGMISSEGVTIYRHDFNIDPWGFWEKGDETNDEVDREGITEIRYIEGFYKFWDELLQRHPGLIIDNCASGGRRIDLETISRSVALWRSDYQYFEPIGQQCMTYALGFFLPTAATGTKTLDPYRFRSAMTCGLAINIDPFLPDFKEHDLAERITEFKRVRLLYYGDFYPLTEYSTDDDTWISYQFHREDLKQGMILAFRRDHAKSATLVVKPRGLSLKTAYSVEFVDDRIEKTMTGAEMNKGIMIKIQNAPGAALIVYSWY